MAKKLTSKDSVGDARTPRYRAQKGHQDWLKIVPSSAPGDDGEPTRALFWEHRYFAGEREDGSKFFITAHPNPKENYAQQKGYEAKTQAMCLVIHLATKLAGSDRVVPVLQPKMWCFGGDKWKSMQGLIGLHGEDEFSKQEIVIVCKDEGFQKLDIQVAPAKSCIFPRLTQAQKTALREALAAAKSWIAAELKPDDRKAQVGKISGRRVEGSGPSLGGEVDPSGDDLVFDGDGLGDNEEEGSEDVASDDDDGLASEVDDIVEPDPKTAKKTSAKQTKTPDAPKKVPAKQGGAKKMPATPKDEEASIDDDLDGLLSPD